MVLIILPTLRISGGIQEAVRLGRDLKSRGVDTRILSLWKHPHSVSIPDLPVRFISNAPPRKCWAAFELPFMLLRYYAYLIFLRRSMAPANIAVILTHYSTLPFRGLSSLKRRFCFVQGLEWLFLPEGILRSILQKYILRAYSACHILTTNSYLTFSLKELGITQIMEVPIWADPQFAQHSSKVDRPIDVSLVLRGGHTKRMDLYLDLLDRIGDLTSAIITPDDKIATLVEGKCHQCLLRPSREAMTSLFACSKTFVLLSDHEGFALPPLEAMGSGCIPLCRDAGGVRCYMTGPLEKYLIPLDASMDSVAMQLRYIITEARSDSLLPARMTSHFEEGLKAAMNSREAALDALMHLIQPQ